MERLGVTNVSREDIYDMLFGTRRTAARRAFTQSLEETEFPVLWFELPLFGTPWFDLFVLTELEKLAPEDVDEARLPQGVAPIFQRLAKKEGARQLALSWVWAKRTRRRRRCSFLFIVSRP